MLFAAFDGTTVATTLGAAAITGLLGYLIARTQARGAIRSVELENERLREQREQAHLEHRQGYYHRTLERLERFWQMATDVLGMQATDFIAWLDQFRMETTGIILFGRADVKVAAEAMYEAVMSIERVVYEQQQSGASMVPKDDLRQAHSDLTQRFESVRRELLDAMRADVAPD